MTKTELEQIQNLLNNLLALDTTYELALDEEVNKSLFSIRKEISSRAAKIKVKAAKVEEVQPEDTEGKD